MKRSLTKSVMALTVLAGTLGALNVYQASSLTNYRVISSIENPEVKVAKISAEEIREQRIRIEEVTMQVQKANGDMLTVKKRIVEIEKKLTEKKSVAFASFNLAETMKLREELKDLKKQKDSLESSIVDLKSKHKKALDTLTSTNKKLVQEVKSSKAKTDILNNKIAELERAGQANSHEMAKLKEQLKSEKSRMLEINSEISQLEKQVESKNNALAQALTINQEISDEVTKLNDKLTSLESEFGVKVVEIEKLNGLVQELTDSKTTLESEKSQLEDSRNALELSVTEKDQIIQTKENEIAEQKNQILCQQEEIKINTQTITDLQEQVKKSTKAITDSSDAIKSLKEERDESKEKIAKLEKENKNYKEESKKFDYVLQMMMQQFMRMPQMMMSSSFSQPSFHNPLDQFSMSDFYLMKMMGSGGSHGLGMTGLPMFDPYATPSVINNNYFNQKVPYGGDFNVRDLYGSRDRAPSSYFEF